jgi:fructose-bisphosphate aldolase class II
MNLVNIKEILEDATKGGYAIPAFNILNHLTVKGVMEECQKSLSPVIIQTSVATVKFYGVKELVAMVKSEAVHYDIPVALHLDHCTDMELAKKCAESGWTSIMFDGSHLPFDENIRLTKGMVDYAKNLGVSVEGELGAIAGVEDHISVADEDAHLADLDQSKEFVAKTGITAFAPAVGTAHGQYKGEPKLDYQRFQDIRKVSGDVPLVVHGGTGLSKEAFQKFIDLGASKINISTAIKQAYMKSVRSYVVDNGKSAPLEFDRYVINGVRETVRDHIEIFGSGNRV